jgi:transposase-like protein
MTTPKGYARAGEPAFPQTLAAIAGFLETGMSQAALAREIGVSETTMAEWIRYHFPEHRWAPPTKTARNALICRLVKEGRMTYQAVGDLFCISRQYVARIVNRSPSPEKTEAFLTPAQVEKRERVRQWLLEDRPRSWIADQLEMELSSVHTYIRRHFPDHVRHRTPKGGLSLCPMPPAPRSEALVCAGSS